VDTLKHQRRLIDAFVLIGLSVYIGSICLDSYSPYSFIFRDGSFYAQTNRSIAESFSLRQEGFQPSSWYDGSLPWYRELDDAWSNVSIGADGEWYPKHSYLMPLFSTPFFIVFGPAGLLLFNCLVLVLGLFSGYKLASAFSKPASAAVAVLVIAFSPVVTFLAYSYSHDVFCAALVAIGCALLAFNRPLAGGVLLGLSLYAKVTNIVVVAPMCLALTWGDRRSLFRTLVACSVPLAGYGLANLIMYGHPLTTSYHRILTVSDGLQYITSYGDAFNTPLSEGLDRFFSTSHQGELVQIAAVPFFGFAGALFLLRRAPAVAIGLTAALAGFLYTFAMYRYSGARFFMPWLVLSPIPMSAAFDSFGSIGVGLFDRWFGWMNRYTGRLATFFVGTASVALVASFWIFQATAPASRSMSGDVEHLSVTLGGRPCDYFNMTHYKWECSHLEPGGDYFVGRSLGDQCSFSGRTMLWAPPNPGRYTRTVKWVPREKGSRVRVTWGLDPRSRKGPVKFELQIGDSPAVEIVSDGHGRLSHRVLDAPAGPESPVIVTIPPSGRKGLFLCLDVDVLSE